MKLITAALIVIIAFTASCNQLSDASHMEGMSAMKDSIFKKYPNVAAITINIQNRELLIVTLGSKRLAGIDPFKKVEIAGNIGAMALRIIGTDAGLKQEKLIITPNERNTLAEPADGIVTTISLDSLAKSR